LPQGAGGSGGWVRATRLASLEAGRPTRVSIYGIEDDAWTRAEGRRLGDVWLVRESDTKVTAFSAVCPHLGCSIEVQGNGFFCPCHDSGFTPAGARKGGPSPRDMDPLEVRTEGDWVMVKFVRFKLGVPERVVG
jgi:Rieske Fe-S protein